MGNKLTLELAIWPTDGSLRLTARNEHYGYSAQWILDEDGDVCRTVEGKPTGLRVDNLANDLTELFELLNAGETDDGQA